MRKKSNLLDEKQKNEVIAILTVGCSRKTAARYVGSTASAILETARTDTAFAEKLQHAQEQAEIASMKNIHNAAKQERYWKASAWILERKNPEEFRLQSPDTLSAEQVEMIVTYLSRMIVEEIKSPTQRKKILAQLETFMKKFGSAKPQP